jgi:thiosulfate/3-mercaptopyruvate sulfurtransferase
VRLKPRLLFASIATASLVLLQSGAAAGQHKPAASIPVADLVQPVELAASLRNATAPRPVIFQVGSHVLYSEAHIAGAEYVGAAGHDDGLRTLRDRVAKLPKDAPIVIYCGCCPWSRCPNIAPAYDQLRALGYSHVKVLYIAENFGANWVDPGYPVDKGQ